MASSYTSANLVEAEIRATESFSSSTTPTLATVNEWIEEESELIDQIAGRTYTSTTYTEYIDYDGESEVLTLKHSPIISITSVEYNQNALGSSEGTSWVTKTAETDYSSYDERGEIVILPSWSPYSGRKRIRVTYVAGYSTIPKQVQMLATKTVALRVLNSVLQNNVNTADTGGSLTLGSISIVTPDNVSVGTFKQLNEDISMLKKEVVSGFGVFRYSTY